jgi:hypothetical protein
VAIYLGRLADGTEVLLPHPDVPCAWCSRYVMDEEARPNSKDICTDCFGEHD